MAQLDLIRARSRSVLRPLRRTILRRRRLLAAGCVGVAVLSGLHATAAPPPVTVAVPVLSRDVAAGAVLSAADVRTTAYAPGSVPPGVVDHPTGRTTATAIARGEPLTTTRLVGAGLVRGEAGTTAVPVRLPDAAMAALLVVGDRIDLLAVDPQGGAPALVARGALVLALPVATPSTTDGLPGRLVVLGVPQEVVSRVADVSVRLFVTFAYSH